MQSNKFWIHHRISTMAELEKGNSKTTADGENSAIISPLDELRRLDAPQFHVQSGYFSKPDPNSASWGNWGRSQMDTLKAAALNSKTVYAFCFVGNFNDPKTTIVACGLFLICMVIQIAIPLSILITMQPVETIDADNPACPRRSGVLVKVFGFALSAYFVNLTLGLCTNKLRGLNFLRNFVDLGRGRRLCLEIGIVAQLLGIVVTSLTQYLLFIGNTTSYLRLLLQSLAMQFCLEVDIKILSYQLGSWTVGRLNAVSKDEFVASAYGGLGEPDAPMPAKTLAKISSMVNSEKIVLAAFFILGLFLSVSLVVCM